MPTRFFLTHSWKDIDFARRLRNDLVASGVDGFFDAYSIKPGDMISAEINRGLEACDIYVPILSYAALTSPWCEEEIHAAITLGKLPGRNGRPRIVSVLVEDCVDKMPILLRARLYIEFADRYDEAIEELLTKAFGVPGRVARGKAEQERVAKEKAEAERLAREKGEQQRLPRKRKPVPSTIGDPELKSAAAYYNRGVDYYKKGKLERALADFNQALELDPKYASAYSGRGTVYRDKGDLDRALADYTRALELDPKYFINYYNRGIAYKQKGDLDRALADYTRALELGPKYIDAYYHRGLVHRKKGSKAEAIADFEAYVRLAPNASDRAEVEKWIQELKR
jgi:tetratricopeptide (TPR) repeat protein